MAFLEKVRPVKVQVLGSRVTPEEKCRAKMIALIQKQSSPRKSKRSWFINIGDREFFAPRYANVNIVQRMTGGRKNAYPVSSFTWLLVPSKIDNPEKRKAITDFLHWMMTDGQNMTEALAYARLPRPVQQKELKAISKVQ